MDDWTDEDYKYLASACVGDRSMLHVDSKGFTHVCANPVPNKFTMTRQCNPCKKIHTKEGIYESFCTSCGSTNISDRPRRFVLKERRWFTESEYGAYLRSNSGFKS